MVEAVPPAVPLAARELESDEEPQDAVAIPATIMTASFRYMGYGLRGKQ
jgi:hypothetical protein